MELTWMGRNRALVKQLTRHSNIVNRALNNASTFSNEVEMNCVELQILESLIEHEDENKIMSEIANDIGIPRSAMTLSSKHLLKQGLIERFKIEGNNKNIIIRPTSYGRKIYQQYMETTGPELFSAFFEELDNFSEAELSKITKALQTLNESLCHDSTEKLIKFEEKK
ncbi:MAG: MarR family transcriptional regulator [Lachnospiraceae bacterium]|nr:MarR family transcriptional regulator [Lachnospiraceae bacterium]